MSGSSALPALPGADSLPGTGPVEPPLLDELLDDGGPPSAHRDLLAGDHRDLVAALEVAATAEDAVTLREGLLPGDNGLRVVLAADSLDGLRAARDQLLDVDAVEVIGTRLTLPELAGPDPAGATHHLLDALDSSIQAWITLPPGEAAGAVLQVLVADGAENVTLDVRGGDPAVLADLLRRLVDGDVSFRVAGVPGVEGVPGPSGGRFRPGLLNLLCATRAALNGAEPAELAEVLATRDVAPLVSALRRMSAADAAVLRAFLVAAAVPDATRAVADLEALDLITRPEG